MISHHSVNQITKSTVVHYNHCNNNNTGLILFYLFLYNVHVVSTNCHI
jgi:hypothetical protein